MSNASGAPCLTSFVGRQSMIEQLTASMRLVLVAASSVALFCLLSCSRGRNSTAARDRFNQLSQEYLKGDWNEARQCMQDTIRLMDQARFPNPSAPSHARWLAYSRLSVLEKRAGNETLSEAYLLQARYWYFRKFELSGETTEKAFENVRSFSMENCVAFIDKWDRAHNEGKSPNYMRERRQE